MRLKTIKKLLYQKRIKNLLFTVSILFLLHNNVAGQSRHFVFNFNNTNVSTALLEISQNANIRIAFDNTALERYSLTKSVTANNIEELLTEILAETDYTFEFKHNTWLIKKRTAESVAKASSHDILGVVFDNETLERLPYASVYLSSVNRIIPTTVDGTFSTQIKENEELVVEVRYLGYQTLDTILTVKNGGDKLLLGLSRQIQNLATIEVTGEKLEMVELGKEAGHITFNPAGFSDLPNYGETDVFRSLQLLPGISAREGSAQLNIRGSSADQNLVIFDGFTLYNLDHFFGVFFCLKSQCYKKHTSVPWWF
jgi:preprotein translocase subunit SecA